MPSSLLETSWWVPCYGLVGATLTLPWATGYVRRTGPRPAAYFNLLMTLAAFVHGFLLLQHTRNGATATIVWHWLQAPGLDLSFSLLINSVTTSAMELVTGLSILAQIFALGYLEKDWGLARFFALMGFFEAALSGIALSDSLLLSYGLLEVLTLSTYLLIGFWYAQPLVVKAARDAFLTKRVGDILLLMGVVAVGSLAGSYDFPALYDWAETAHLPEGWGLLLGLALIAGPTGKCAQVPLHLWLDEAMEGPNPASIMRNSVVVAAGAYILIKLQPILVVCPGANAALILIGAVTAISESLVAIAQIDIKRALSHSTSVYLGLVFIGVGTNWTDFALFVLLTHAIAKALLFMSIGSVIMTTNCQDLTELGGLGGRMPATSSAFVIGGLSLIGLLPLGAFWSFYRGINHYWLTMPALVVLILVVNILTAVNLTRVFRLVFLGAAQPKTRRAPEVPWPLAVPMVTLSILNLLVPIILQRVQLLPTTINWTIVALLVTSGLFGVLLGGFVTLKRSWTRPIKVPLRFVQDLLAYDFYIEELYRYTVIWAVRSLSQCSAWVDRHIVDRIVNTTGMASLVGGELLKYSATGQSQAYLLLVFVGVAILGGAIAWLLL
ncbi:NAD(P)H-quinone oxidoreductase subunit F [Parathermosynechococcus lividus PCC 6715]|uniref:NAD(P)H-quinone oxidoreductase subunit F n=1 Tax=Parathermosynechococcus lividus PCC 6715 TaxID=1917166 RepID=A0A2D2Q3C1_PARLV|nr:NAD(P)H-quinone oxidoreductase subunit F [Thermostichus lividus]ATS18919.1 NAD(P)H-quinone oxidoreductase subunit F [Thermostichus lividus PCC 6715]